MVNILRVRNTVTQVLNHTGHPVLKEMHYSGQKNNVHVRIILKSIFAIIT